MSDGVFKAPKAKNSSSFLMKSEEDSQVRHSNSSISLLLVHKFDNIPLMSSEDQSIACLSPLPKKRRTAEDFFTFCNFILEYENYEAQKQEELRTKNSGSPLDSTGSGTESHKSESTASSITSLEDRKPPDLESGGKKRINEDSWDLVTCYCLKPFAGRPMIECSDCLTWIHLSCAKIRKSNIPKDFICQRCRDAKQTTRRSQRVRNEKRRISA